MLKVSTWTKKRSTPNLFKRLKGIETYSRQYSQPLLHRTSYLTNQYLQDGLNTEIVSEESSKESSNWCEPMNEEKFY